MQELTMRDPALCISAVCAGWDDVAPGKNLMKGRGARDSGFQVEIVIIDFQLENANN